MSSQRVTRALEQAIEQRGLPESIRCDNGPELTSRHFLGWCEERTIQLIHIQPGRPMQNGHVDSMDVLAISGVFHTWDNVTTEVPVPRCQCPLWGFRACTQKSGIDIKDVYGTLGG